MVHLREEKWSFDLEWWVSHFALSTAQRNSQVSLVPGRSARRVYVEDSLGVKASARRDNVWKRVVNPIRNFRIQNLLIAKDLNRYSTLEMGPI